MAAAPPAPETDPADAFIRSADDPELYDLLIQMYRDWGLDKQIDGFGNRVEKLEAARRGPKEDRVAILRHLGAEDKGPRRDFVARAGDFLAERAAGRKSEEMRLRMGRGRIANVLRQQRAAASDPAKATALGRTRGLVESMNRLGQSAVLG